MNGRRENLVMKQRCNSSSFRYVFREAGILCQRSMFWGEVMIEKSTNLWSSCKRMGFKVRNQLCYGSKKCEWHETAVLCQNTSTLHPGKKLDNLVGDSTFTSYLDCCQSIDKPHKTPDFDSVIVYAVLTMRCTTASKNLNLLRKARE